MEINPAAREIAASLGIDVFASLQDVKGRTFTRVITSHALEHVTSPFDTLVELKSFVRSDGLLLWLSPMDDWREKKQRKWNEHDRDFHLYTWTPLLMGNLLNAAGYDIKSISILTHAWPPRVIRNNLWKMSPFLFHKIAYIWAIVRRRRQLLAVVSPKS